METSKNSDKNVQSLKVYVSSEETAIHALENRFVSAFNSGDIDAIMKNYIDDETLVLFDIIPRTEYLGADAYRKAWTEMFSNFKGRPKIEIIDLNITAAGNVGYGHCFMRVTGTSIQGTPVDRTVRVTDGYQKIGDTWVIVHEHISVPVDLKNGKMMPARP